MPIAATAIVRAVAMSWNNVGTSSKPAALEPATASAAIVGAKARRNFEGRSAGADMPLRVAKCGAGQQGSYPP